jgi:hypothetical protein
MTCPRCNTTCTGVEHGMVNCDRCGDSFTYVWDSALGQESKPTTCNNCLNALDAEAIRSVLGILPTVRRKDANP